MSNAAEVSFNSVAKLTEANLQQIILNWRQRRRKKSEPVLGCNCTWKVLTAVILIVTWDFKTIKKMVCYLPVPNREGEYCVSLLTMQSGLRMRGEGILWMLCLSQILSAGAWPSPLPVSDDEDLTAEGLLNRECAHPSPRIGLFVCLSVRLSVGP